MTNTNRTRFQAIGHGQSPESGRLPDAPFIVGSAKPEQDAVQDSQMQFVEKLVESFRFEDARLPTLPQAVVYLERAIRDETVSMTRLAKLLEKDPVLATRLIRVANSAYFKSVSPVESVPEAVSRVGFSASQNIALVLLSKAFTPSHKLVANKVNELWSQSLRIAAMASSLSHHYPLVDANRAMLGGLLYNVGAMLLLTKIDERVKVITHPGILDHMIDRHAAQFGLKLLQHWEMDPDLQDVVGNRNHWQRDHSHAADLADLVMVARCCISLPEGTAPDLHACQQLPCYRRLQQFVYRSRSLEELVAEADESVEETLELLAA